ncbi:protein of unknown function [Streptomyces sp. KY75]|nr:protein of unknown function [Streptomyces sp. KY70]CAD5976467.1 protein of unknown function [Streptomyces sp. KY75]
MILGRVRARGLPMRILNLHNFPRL